MDNMMKDLLDFPSSIVLGYSLPGNLKISRDIDRIIVTGVGSSAFPGELLASFLETKTQVFVNNDYSLPAFAGKSSLVFAISEYGDAEEAIEAYLDAKNKGCSIVVMASGGELGILAKKDNVPFVLTPKDLPVGTSYGTIFFAMLRVLYNSGLAEDMEKQVESLSRSLKSGKFQEKGEEIAKSLVQKTPLIYSSKGMGAVGKRWKHGFNQMVGIHAFTNIIPEMNHNEIVGYSWPMGNFHSIFLKDDEDSRRVQMRMDISKEIIKQNKVDVTEVMISGDDRLQKLFFGAYLGDWVSYWLAKRYTDKDDSIPDSD